MILIIEGPRNSGKTFLIEQFIKSCNDPRIEYYKFYFANHIKSLNLVKHDNDPILHYFSLGNIMTIMEMNLLEEYKDKIWIFDRAIISAYTWAILRNRMSSEEAEAEYMKLINMDLYSNIKILLVTTNGQTNDAERTKDIWDGAHSTFEEMQIMLNLMDLGIDQLSNETKNNKFGMITNLFTQESISDFTKACHTLLGLEPNK